MTNNLLKLKAHDTEDVAIFSTVLQDAIAPIIDIAYTPADQTVIMVVQRFRWEMVDAEQKRCIDVTIKPCFERVLTAITVHGVSTLKQQGLDLNDTARMLDLLALIQQDQCLQFVFAGEARLKLSLAEGWNMILADYGEPWPTTHLPCHVADN